MKTIRTRLLLSHVLPLLIIFPLLAIFLIYIIESQVLLTRASQTLLSQANLMVQMIQREPNIWRDSQVSETFVHEMSVDVAADITLLDVQGDVLASSRGSEVEIEPRQINENELDRVTAGATIIDSQYSLITRDNRLQVLIPVQDVAHDLVGILQLTSRLDSLASKFEQTRFLIIGAVGLALLTAVISGIILDTSLNRRLSELLDAIQRIADGRGPSRPETRAPREFNAVFQAVQTLHTDLKTTQANRQKLLANLVHELGRPLGALKAANTALIAGAFESADMRKDLLSGIDAQIDLLRLLLDNLAQLYSQSSGQFEISPQPVPLGGWLGQVLSTWQVAAVGKGLNWRTTLPDELPLIEIDPDRMAQVLGNLLSNAIKYTPAGGEVAVDVAVMPDAVHIRVADTGIGMTPHEQSQVFEPFFRGPQSHRFPQGMGLGLTIAREITQLHGGVIEIMSEPGAGSQFIVVLPRNSPEIAIPKR